MEASTQETSATLAALQPGDRAWFWLCEASEPALLLSPLSADPGMARLVAAVEQQQQDVPIGSASCLGVATVSEAGRLTLGSPAASAPLLSALARWCRAHLPAHPGLARLSGTRLIQFDERRRVLARFDEPTLWDGVRHPGPAAPDDDTGARLDDLRPGQAAWVWLCASGPDGQPVLVLTRQDQDPDGEALGALVRRLRGRGAGPGTGGVLRILSGGGVTVATEADPGSIAGALTALARRPALRRLNGAALVQLGGGALRSGLRVVSPDLSRQVEAVSAVAAGAPAWVWLSLSGPEQRPVVLIDTDRERLKADAAQVGGAGPVGRGRLALDGGALAFRMKAPLPGAAAAISDWITDNAEAWPLLLGLEGATLAADGWQEVVDEL